MKWRLALLIPVCALAVALPALAATSTTTHEVDVPFARTVFVPCANDGAGEFVELSGTLRVLAHITTHDDGRATVVSHVQPNPVNGLGLTTGDRYMAKGLFHRTVTWRILNVGVGPITWTQTDQFRIIGQGPGNNSHFHGRFHFTFNANSELTVLIDEITVDCN